MDFKDLGYTEKWFEYGLLTEEILNNQFSEYQKGEDKNGEHYRYGTFLNWLKGKEEFTDFEIENFIELALEDTDALMAGSAVKALFTHSQISENQYKMIQNELHKFGDWTRKLIQREELKKKIENEILTKELIEKCIEHKREYNENALIELIISKADKTEFIEQFTQNDFGKSIRNLAKEKLKRLKKLAEKS